MLKVSKKKLSKYLSLKLLVVLFLIFLLGFSLRIYHIEFGLPHSFHADEPEIVELAIKYTFEAKDIINGNFHKLKPISFVYGTVPTYLNTLALFKFVKVANLVEYKFEKMDLYVYLRVVNAFLSSFLIILGFYLYKIVFESRSKLKTLTFGSIVTALLIALNWKLIVHGHYVNVDILLTLFLTVVYIFSIVLMQSKNIRLQKFCVIMIAIFFGLSVGTKVTAALGLPLILFAILKDKKMYYLAVFMVISFGVFFITNPFSFIFGTDFGFRVYSLAVKENGVVFDSVDYGMFKYFYSLFYICTPLVVLSSFFGIYKSIKSKLQLNIHIYLIGMILIYLVFYTLGSRRVDRWMLPILPIILVYASYGFYCLTNYLKNRYLTYLILILLSLSYLFFPALLLLQYDRYTPKAQAYLWMQQNVPISANKLVITEEGLDPMNKLQGTHVDNVNVYESKNGHLIMPENPIGYDFVVLSAKSMDNYDNPYLQQKFPLYVSWWIDFENKVFDQTRYKLVKSFVLPKPNLVELSDVFIYQSLLYTQEAEL